VDERTPPIDGVPVFHLDRLTEVVNNWGIRLAIVAVPAVAAQQVADQLVAAGIAGVMNFAPVTLNLPRHVRTIGVDLAMELEQLAFAVTKQIEGGSEEQVRAGA
ncbi:MAG: redox-sensing transcriptional repressor Rex, partial [Planctomycetota bacterium]